MARTKKEIDKELMYKKLMPSGPRTIKTPIESVSPEVSVAAQDTAVVSPSPVSSVHKPPEPRRVTIPALDNQQMVVVNTMEALVLSKLDSVLERFSCCRCDRCKKDIIALALNKLPPKYMVLAEGQPEPDVDAQLNAQVVTAMIQSVIKVRANPRH